MRRYIVPQIEAVCQSVTDSLWWKIKQPEFAFTLYYYDRAGNRVAVVPPDGVEMLSDDSTVMVPNARAMGDTLRPKHRKVVLWRYTASNQVWMRHHPDRGTDLTWYDPADRPIATQDARQRAENKVSFIKYDSLSRPIEGGVASLSSNFTNFAYENNVPINTSIVWGRFIQVYDTVVAGSPIPSGHFRGRVTTHKVWQKFTGTEEPDYIVYYDYDLMGRVKREIHEIPMLKRFKHQFFEMSYLYDAISGKVREMIYRDDGVNNMLVVIRDQRVPVSTDGSTVVYYKPLVDEILDYYPLQIQRELENTIEKMRSINIFKRIFNKESRQEYKILKEKRKSLELMREEVPFEKVLKLNEELSIQPRSKDIIARWLKRMLKNMG